MQEPYGKGLATHTNPESCAASGNTAGEAFSGTHAQAGETLAPCGLMCEI